MDENRIEGTVRKVAGKAQEGAGWVVGDARVRTEGNGQRNPWIGPRRVWAGPGKCLGIGPFRRRCCR
jgi:hypothetical protein